MTRLPSRSAAVPTAAPSPLGHSASLPRSRSVSLPRSRSVLLPRSRSVPLPRSRSVPCVPLAALLLSLTLVSACALPASRVPFSVNLPLPESAVASSRLFALSPEAKSGRLTQRDPSAWFALGALRAAAEPDRGTAEPTSLDNASFELELLVESPVPVTLSVGAVFPADLDSSGRLVRDPAPRPLSTLTNVSGTVRVRMHAAGFAGFAVTLADFSGANAAGADSAKADRTGDVTVRVLSASIEPYETGWDFRADSPWYGFGDGGGNRDCAAKVVPSGSPFAVEVPPDSSVEFGFDPARANPGTPQSPGRMRFTAGSRGFGWRVSPTLSATWLPSFLVAPPSPSQSPLSAILEPDSGTSSLSSLRVVHGEPYHCAEPGNPRSPIVADPFVAIEWPRSAWRRDDFEVFAWDRFPSVLIFDTADFAAQERLFNRLAFFVEKTGYRDTLLTDAELAGMHGYNAHDYRADSLADFFEAARLAAFPLGSAEIELRDILLAEGILAKNGEAYIPGAGAVISLSRQSASYLRYLFVAHEGFHGIYFTNPDFRDAVADVYRSTDPRAIGYLHAYFTVVDSLGYDTSDAYLMENEFMAYLMQQPLDRVAPYFTGVVDERFLRYGGDKALSDYVRATEAADFAEAARKLNDFAFERWGLSGGRTGMWFFDD